MAEVNNTNGEAKPEDFRAEENAFSNISHVVAVMSGKGGVGKSLVTASLANSMAVQGHSVGILDADITGPSIPKMYGMHGSAQSDGNGIYPFVADNGIEVMSTNLLLPNEEDPVIWRGPVIAGVVKQFWTD
ncbi:MAG: P-loop NTPase, partial [Eubacterium sp.]|nr:P-loop NTPase [Eubacterium sp.]